VYSTNAIYQADGFKVTKGTTKTHAKTADGGNTITSHFWCVLDNMILFQANRLLAVTVVLPCGARVIRSKARKSSRYVHLLLHILQLKTECMQVGTMDDPKALEDAKPVAELYAATRVSWVQPIPGAEQKKAMS